MVAKDYKRSRVRREPFGGWTGFALGLVAGLAIGVAIHLLDRPAAAGKDSRGPARPPASASAAETPSAEQVDSYDFYKVLPKFEVVIPERDKEVRRDVPARPVAQKGSYILQAGSYRNFAEADRIRAQLALAGIESKVQRVSVDTDTWHRVRIGPMTDLAEINRVRNKLREADLDVLVIKIE
jgi:cell division protein FtsN